MIGQILKTERNKQSLSQKALGEKSGVSFVTINKIEKGSGARVRILEKIFSALGKRVIISIEDIQTEKLSEPVL